MVYIRFIFDSCLNFTLFFHLTIYNANTDDLIANALFHSKTRGLSTLDSFALVSTGQLHIAYEPVKSLHPRLS